MNTSEVLNKAADLIEERGWDARCGWPNADGGTDTGRLCLEGGIMAVVGLGTNSGNDWIAKLTRNCPAYTAVKSHLGDRSPFMWNDEAGRTAAEVIEVLRATAVIEAARESESTQVSA